MATANCQMHGQVFTIFIVLNEKPFDRYTWSGRRLTKKQTTPRPDNVWPDMWKHMSDASKRKEKQKWAIEKPKLDNARRWRGVFFIEPDDEEFKRILKNARRKLQIRMPAAMLRRSQLHQHRKTCALLDNAYMLVLLKPTNLWRYAWKGFRARTMKTTSQEKAWIHCVATNLCTNFIYSYAWSHENSRCKDSSGKITREIWDNTIMAADESQQKWGDRWSKD